MECCLAFCAVFFLVDGIPHLYFDYYNHELQPFFRIYAFLCKMTKIFNNENFDC